MGIPCVVWQRCVSRLLATAANRSTHGDQTQRKHGGGLQFWNRGHADVVQRKLSAVGRECIAGPTGVAGKSEGVNLRKIGRGKCAAGLVAAKAQFTTGVGACQLEGLGQGGASAGETLQTQQTGHGWQGRTHATDEAGVKAVHGKRLSV